MFVLLLSICLLTTTVLAGGDPAYYPGEKNEDGSCVAAQAEVTTPEPTDPWLLPEDRPGDCCTIFKSENIMDCMILGNDDGCGRKLDLGEGDCDSDGDCKGDLLCGKNNCSWNEGSWFGYEDDDCCYLSGTVDGEYGEQCDITNQDGQAVKSGLKSCVHCKYGWKWVHTGIQDGFSYVYYCCDEGDVEHLECSCPDFDKDRPLEDGKLEFSQAMANDYTSPSSLDNVLLFAFAAVGVCSIAVHGVRCIFRKKDEEHAAILA